MFSRARGLAVAPGVSQSRLDGFLQASPPARPAGPRRRRRPFSARQPTQTMIALFAPGGRATLVVPAGFAAAVFAEGLAGPRFLAFGPDGRLYVAEGGRNRIVVAGRPRRATAHRTSPRCSRPTWPRRTRWPGTTGALYVGVPTGVLELEGQRRRRHAPTSAACSSTTIRPTATARARCSSSRDGRMVVSVGSSCNVCEEERQAPRGHRRLRRPGGRRREDLRDAGFATRWASRCIRSTGAAVGHQQRPRLARRRPSARHREHRRRRATTSAGRAATPATSSTRISAATRAAAAWRRRR